MDIKMKKNRHGLRPKLSRAEAERRVEVMASEHNVSWKSTDGLILLKLHLHHGLGFLVATNTSFFIFIL